MSKIKKKRLHVVPEDWDREGKKDTRPVERREKPVFSMSWKKFKELLNLD